MTVTTSDTIRVTINGAPRDIPDRLSVKALVEHLGIVDGPVAVELNGVVVPRRRHVEQLVVAGDVVEIVHFVGGG
jgi:sulfur carrier protein